MRLILAPTTALLLPEVDPGESHEFARFRDHVLGPLRETAAHGPLGVLLSEDPLPGALLASLGGIGLDHAVLLRPLPAEPDAGQKHRDRAGQRDEAAPAWTPEHLSGPELEAALYSGQVRVLSLADAVLVLLAAHATGDGSLRLRNRRDLDRLEEGAWLAGLDLAADAHPHSPVPHDPDGAAVNRRLIHVLRESDLSDVSGRDGLAARAAGHTGDVTVLRTLAEAGRRPVTTGLHIHAEHGIDYLTVALDLTAAPRPACGARPHPRRDPGAGTQAGLNADQQL
ncbi:hypothetical protein GCM10027079_01250 [Sediminivirga luteola]|uniref:Uncharacterized protein n=1 Tax=Sediminivirga luteola TaxID=1774748 RepID=A0A8J2XF52_9MICO|nr:hypothetical protein GCM10011333_13390 [Sediminivirga luteola]